MANRRMTMRKIRETLRLRHEARMSVRQISTHTDTSVGAIQNLLNKAARAGVGWPLPEELADEALVKLLYPSRSGAGRGEFQLPEWSTVHQELKRKDMTLQLLWEEYIAQHPGRCYSYSQFCALFVSWRARQKRSMRQTHRFGEKSFVDYCGCTVPVHDAEHGKVRQAQVFVGVLGASNYTYAEASWGQTLQEWLASHTRMVNFFGGCSEMIVPDNLKSAVHKACRYDPDVNPSYQQWAEHYGVAVVLARPRRPKDKSKVEVSVQIVERWILARLRHQRFFSLAQLNERIRELLDDLNQRPFKQMPGNRLDTFTRLEQPALRALPRHAYQYVDIKRAKVGIDYHVHYACHYYSVPHQYVGLHVEVHGSDSLVRMFYQGNEIAAHRRKRSYGFTTEVAHMPRRHAEHSKWNPARLKSWARRQGPEIQLWVSAQLERKAHPEQAYRVCLGLLNLTRHYPVTRINQACRIANQENLMRLKQIKSILQTQRDQLPQHTEIAVELPQQHENIRGAKHFH